MIKVPTALCSLQLKYTMPTADGSKPALVFVGALSVIVPGVAGSRKTLQARKLRTCIVLSEATIHRSAHPSGSDFKNRFGHGGVVGTRVHRNIAGIA